jgi:hypothetical protein
MMGQLRSKFAADPKAKELHAQVHDLAADIADKANGLQKQLHTNDRAKINTNVVRAANDLAKELAAEYRLKPDQIAVNFLIGMIAPPGGSEANVAAEIAYVRIKKLKNADGYSYENFYIMLGFPSHYIGNTGVKAPSLVDRKTGSKNVDSEGNKLRDFSVKSVGKIFIAQSSKFKIPAKIRWDATANKPADMRQIVHDMLVRDGIVGSSVKRELPAPAEHFNLVHNNIASTTVKGDMIEVRVKDVRLVDQTSVDLLQQVKAIVAASNPKNKDIIRTKVQHDSGIIRFIFTLPARLKGRLLSRDQLLKLKNVLDLSDAEVKKIQTALEDHADE